MRYVLQSDRCGSRVDERMCPFAQKAESGVLDTALPRTFKFGASDPVVCKTACFMPVFLNGACAIMRVSVAPGKLMLLIGKDTLKVLEARFNLMNNIGISIRRLRDPLIFFSTNVMSEAFSAKRLPGSRTTKDLQITSGRGSFQRLHRTFRRLRWERTTASERDSQVEEELD